MFERLQKPFLTVETGEAYQPVRLAYKFTDEKKLISELNKLKCLEHSGQTKRWTWYWRDECDALHLESVDSFKRNTSHPTRIATLTIHDNMLYLNSPSFKRACLAVPFFYKQFSKGLIEADHADFINKVFSTTEHLPHGFSELFDEIQLERLVEQRLHDYKEIENQIEHAATADEALKILTEFTERETKKILPNAERYAFHHQHCDDPDVTFLGFYIFMRGRELVAIKRWFGESDYTLSDAAHDTLESVFGGMDIDIIE